MFIYPLKVYVEYVQLAFSIFGLDTNSENHPKSFKSHRGMADYALRLRNTYKWKCALRREQSDIIVNHTMF